MARTTTSYMGRLYWKRLSISSDSIRYSSFIVLQKIGSTHIQLGGGNMDVLAAQIVAKDFKWFQKQQDGI